MSASQPWTYYLDYNKHYLYDEGAPDYDLTRGEFEKISAGDLPEALDAMFGAIVKMPETPWHEVEFGCREKDDVYRLSCHEVSPFNPRGYDFYFKGDGTYIGFRES